MPNRPRDPEVDPDRCARPDCNHHASDHRLFLNGIKRSSVGPCQRDGCTCPMFRHPVISPVSPRPVPNLRPAQLGPNAQPLGEQLAHPLRDGAMPMPPPISVQYAQARRLLTEAAGALTHFRTELGHALGTSTTMSDRELCGYAVAAIEHAKSLPPPVREGMVVTNASDMVLTRANDELIDPLDHGDFPVERRGGGVERESDGVIEQEGEEYRDAWGGDSPEWTSP